MDWQSAAEAGPMVGGEGRSKGRGGRQRSLIEAIPDAVVARAKAAFEARSGNGEWAPLVFDSLVENEGLPSDYRLRFEHPLVRVDVHVLAGAELCDLSGRIDPPESVRVELEPERSELALASPAEKGEFAFGGIPHGLLRLVFVGVAGLSRVRTEWFRV